METPSFFCIFHNLPDYFISLSLEALAADDQIAENGVIEPEVLVDGLLFGEKEVETAGGFVQVGIFVDREDVVQGWKEHRLQLAERRGKQRAGEKGVHSGKTVTAFVIFIIIYIFLFIILLIKFIIYRFFIILFLFCFLSLVKYY